MNHQKSQVFQIIAKKSVFTLAIFTPAIFAVSDSNVEGVMNLLLAIAFLLGLAAIPLSMIWLGFAVFGRHLYEKDFSVIKPVIALVIGISLIFLPSLVAPPSKTLFSESVNRDPMQPF